MSKPKKEDETCLDCDDTKKEEQVRENVKKEMKKKNEDMKVVKKIITNKKNMRTGVIHY